MRARRVVAESLFAARGRGLDSIDPNALIIGLLLEDQDPESFELNEQHPRVKEARTMQPQPKGILFSRECAIPREPFFTATVAADVLKHFGADTQESLEQRVTGDRSASKPNGMPVSAETRRAFEHAQRLRIELHGDKIEPLHLLAAALREECDASRMLNEAGITEQKVLEALRNLEGKWR